MRLKKSLKNEFDIIGIHAFAFKHTCYEETHFIFFSLQYTFVDAPSSSNPEQIQSGETYSEVSEVHNLNCLPYIIMVLRSA
jgi:hypothetical protein